MAAAMAAVVVDTSAEAAISAAVTDILAYPAVEGTSIHPVVEAGFSGGFMDLGLALVRRASVRDISAGDSSAIGMSACSLSAAPAGFGVMIHVGGIRRGGGIIAAITDAGRKS